MSIGKTKAPHCCEALLSPPPVGSLGGSMRFGGLRTVAARNSRYGVCRCVCLYVRWLGTLPAEIFVISRNLLYNFLAGMWFTLLMPAPASRVNGWHFCTLPYFDSRCYNRRMYRIITTTKAIDVNANWTLTIGGVTYFFKWLWMKAAIPERDIVNLMYSG